VDFGLHVFHCYVMFMFFFTWILCFLHLQVHVESHFHVFVNLFLGVQLFLICSCCQTSPLFIWFLGLCFLFIVCPSVALCCLVFVSYLCLQLHSNCFFCKVPHHFSKTFWLRSKASIANEQDTCHEAKPHENPNENLSESPFKENIIL
jgi:hypothetical protein